MSEEEISPKDLMVFLTSFRNSMEEKNEKIEDKIMKMDQKLDNRLNKMNEKIEHNIDKINDKMDRTEAKNDEVAERMNRRMEKLKIEMKRSEKLRLKTVELRRESLQVQPAGKKPPSKQSDQNSKIPNDQPTRRKVTPDQPPMTKRHSRQTINQEELITEAQENNFQSSWAQELGNI